MSGVTFWRYCGDGLSGRWTGKSSRGTGSLPLGRRGTYRSGWNDVGTSTKFGDSGGMAFRDIDVANERTLGLLVGLKRQKLQVKEPMVGGRTLLTISRKGAYLRLYLTLDAQPQGLTGRTLLVR
jgi:hypothetical protein